MIKPIPCRKFKNASTLAWIAKIVEETDEVVQEAAILGDCADIANRGVNDVFIVCCDIVKSIPTKIFAQNV